LILNYLELKKIRKELKLTQQELANKLQVNIRTVQKWESGDVEIRKSTALSIEGLRNKTVEYSKTKSLLEFTFEEKSIPIELIAKHFTENKEAYFEQSEYLKLWLEKIVEIKIEERLSNLGFKTTIVKKL